jgi:hypothetical protein
LPQASCGRVITHLLDTNAKALSADADTLTCFTAVARRCKAASIRVTEMGVDAGTDYVFTTEPGRKPCQVTELSQSYGYTGGNLSSGPIISMPCRLTAVSGKGVMLNCGGQEVLIPASVSTP